MSLLVGKVATRLPWFSLFYFLSCMRTVDAMCQYTNVTSINGVYAECATLNFCKKFRFQGVVLYWFFAHILAEKQLIERLMFARAHVSSIEARNQQSTNFEDGIIPGVDMSQICFTGRILAKSWTPGRTHRRTMSHTADKIMLWQQYTAAEQHRRISLQRISQSGFGATPRNL